VRKGSGTFELTLPREPSSHDLPHAGQFLLRLGAAPVRPVWGNADPAAGYYRPVARGCRGSYSPTPPPPGRCRLVRRPHRASVTAVSVAPSAASSSIVVSRSSHIRYSSCEGGPIRELGKLHAAWWGDARLDQTPWLPMKGIRTPDQAPAVLIQNWESFLGKLSVPGTEEVLSAGELCARYLSAVSVSMFTEPPSG
jgi:hypothetical protein